MKKELPTEFITNELAHSSVFFQPRSTEVEPLSDQAGVAPQTSTQAEAVAGISQQHKRGVTAAIKPDKAKSSPRGGMVSRHHDTMPPNKQAGMTLEAMERIRKAVKQLGKEAATHRFTPEEKRALGEIVYSYERKGVRTSENEITRIAVNWLLSDYQTQGTTSVLARVLASLHG